MGSFLSLDFSLVYFTFSRGQSAPVGDSPPNFGPSAKLDFELEMVRVLNLDAHAVFFYKILVVFYIILLLNRYNFDF